MKPRARTESPSPSPSPYPSPYPPLLLSLLLLLASCTHSHPAPRDVLPADAVDEAGLACECGNGTCQRDCREDAATCARDCAVCGDGTCSPGEDPRTCPIDCCGTCGDGQCRGYACLEDPAACPADCGTACGDATCDKGENPWACPSDCRWRECGNGTCEPTDGGASKCPADCAATCGDCVCEPAEDWTSCPADCGYCGDRVCSPCSGLAETRASCALDCGSLDCVPECSAGTECGGGGCPATPWACGECPTGRACVLGRCVTGPGTFTANPDDTFTDTRSGLVWYLLPEGEALSQPDARSQCQGLVFADRGDWRLPTIDELRTLVAGCAGTEPGGPCAAAAGCGPAFANCLGAPCWACTPRSGPGPDGCYATSGLLAGCPTLWSGTTVPWTGGFAFGVAFPSASVGPRVLADPAGAACVHPLGGTATVGDPCVSDRECVVGFCAVNFPGGYCTLSCADAPCPAGHFCGESTAGRFCYEACDPDVGCRVGYACSPLPEPHCIPSGATELYGTCAEGSPCMEGSCIRRICGGSPCALGTCSLPCSGAADCPSPGVCVQFAGVRTCMPACDADGACGGEAICHIEGGNAYCSP